MTEEYSKFMIIKHNGKLTIAEIGDCVDDNDYESQKILTPDKKYYQYSTKEDAIIDLNKLFPAEIIDPEFWNPLPKVVD